MQVLLTAVAFRSFGDDLSRPEVEWLLMDGDGSLTDVHGSAVAAEDAHPEVAWATSDLFREGAPIRLFFSFVLGHGGLGWFQSPGAGYDDPIFGAMVENGIRVTNAHVNSVPIAEFVLRAVLDEFQGAARWRDQAEGRRWQIHDWREVSGTTWLIIGLGGIGSEVAHRAWAFGATVIGCRRHPSPRGSGRSDRHP